MSRLFLVHLSPATRSVTLAAARAAFPDAEAIEVNTVEEAEESAPAPHPTLLVLAEPDDISAKEALHATDSSALPRWAVVLLGSVQADRADTVPPAEWNCRLLARVFRSAVLQHELAYENLRLRGDLRTMARRVRHDLFSPVGCIVTSSNILEQLPPEAPPVAAMIENIRESAKEFSLIAERVSMVLVASADPPTPAPVGVKSVVAAVLEEAAPEIQRTGGMVSQPGLWPAVRGVRPWLHVIWWNLVTNALKHGGARPQIQLAWRLEDEAYRFSVADHGVAPASQAVLFRPFDRLHTTHASGLGLSIVQRLVALQGGCCGFERHNDNTSEFYFTLPIGPPEHPAGRERGHC